MSPEVTTGETKYLFIDTNIALHYVRIDQIVWRDVTNHSSNMIMVAPVVLRELEEKKFNAKSKKIRKRAEDYVKWLWSISEKSELIEIRPDTTLHLLPEEPTIDFYGYNLKETIADDHLLASILSYQNTTSIEAAIVTSDIGLKTKAKSRGIEVIYPPDKYRQREELDETEKENLILKKKLAEHRNRRPSLALYATEVSIPNFGEKVDFPTDDIVNLMPPSIVSQSEYIDRGIKREMRERPFIKDITSNKAAPDSDVVILDSNKKSITLKIDPVARERHDRLLADQYNEKLHDYYKDFEEFLRQKYEAIVSRGRCYKIAVKVCNNATQLATNVDVIISFPDHIGVFREWVSVAEPAKPKPPTRPYPSNLLETAHGFLNNRYLNPIPNFPPLINPHKSGPRVKNDNEIWYWCDEIKHGFCSKFDNYYIVVPYDHDLTGFQAMCSLSCNELPKPQEQILHFTFTAG